VNNLIVITAHCPTETQEKMLEDCINSVIGLGYHILLISHTHIPLHIQKKCNYYFYDYLNDVTQDDDLLYFNWFATDDVTFIKSKYFTKEFYGFAIYRMFTMASQIAENFGYNNIHHIEYDCILKNRDLIDEHNRLLEKYDSVFYTDNGKETGMIFGAFKSFKVSKLPKLFKKFDRDEMRKIMVGTPLLPLENFTKHIFKTEGIPIYMNSRELVKSGHFFQNNSELRLKHFVPYYNHANNTFYLFFKNLRDTTESLRVYINGSSTFNLLIEPNHWSIRKLCGSNELVSLLILSDNKIIYDKSYTEQDRETLKKNSYLQIINEKNN
jgi:hypothetical protein